MRNFDVVIVGGGHVGCAAALALRALDLTVCLVDARPMATTLAPDWDLRVFTLSPGSERLLTDLGVWQRLDPGRLAPVYHMQIEGDAGAGRLEFDSMAAGVPQLATVVEGNRLQGALEAALADAGVTLLAPRAIEDVRWSRDEVAVTARGEDALRARLLLGADGTESPVRARAGIAWHYRGYGQSGVVAHFRAPICHQGRAFQWFRADGVLAFLPLPGHLLSIVWSTQTARAAELRSMPPDGLAAEVTAASGAVLGDLEPVSASAAFPLRYARADRITGRRLALLGDAAHCVHPLAGQGVNLGFRDVATLAEVLKERPAQSDVAASALLRRYESRRRRDTMSMVAVTDGLHRLFGAEHPLARAIRSSGMRALDRIALVKHALMRQAMA